MKNIEPLNQVKLFGLNNFLNELIDLFKNDRLPNKILLSGQKGLGKSTLAYHFINFVLSKDEEYSYNIEKNEINPNNRSFKTILNKSNPNFILIDINIEKKFIDINQIRDLISNLSKSSFNIKPRFVLIDNIECLNANSVNALLKILEEPSANVNFILINNNKKILSTLTSRCLNFKISLTNKKNLEIANKLLDKELFEIINRDLVNYYSTPGNLYNLAQFGFLNKLDLSKLDLKDFLKIFIDNNYYKKDNLIKNNIFDFIEFYFAKVNLTLSPKIYQKYNYYIKRISDTKRFNLDEESLFIEFKNEMLNE